MEEESSSRAAEHANAAHPSRLTSVKAKQVASSVKPCELRLADLDRLKELLVKASRIAIDENLDRVSSDFMTANQRQHARENLFLTIVIIHGDGTHTFTQNPEHFRFDSLPEDIHHILFDSATGLANSFGLNVLDYVKVSIDLRPAALIGRYDPNDTPTPNESRIEVSGADETWVTGTHNQLETLLGARKTRRSMLHSHKVFSWINLLVLVPTAILLATAADGSFLAAIISAPILRGVAALYVGLLALLLMHSAYRWIRTLFPVVELEGNRPAPLRYVLATTVMSVFTGLVGRLIWWLLAERPR